MKLGFSELIVILVVAMLVIGPDKLPYYARNAGKALKGFRREDPRWTSNYFRKRRTTPPEPSFSMTPPEPGFSPPWWSGSPGKSLWNF
jgi:TatA/E family protein of Tat protein translocase